MVAKLRSRDIVNSGVAKEEKSLHRTDLVADDYPEHSYLAENTVTIWGNKTPWLLVWSPNLTG